MLRFLKICFTNWFTWAWVLNSTKYSVLELPQNKDSIAGFISQREKTIAQNICYVQDNLAYCLVSSDKNHRIGRKTLWQASFKCNAPDEETCDTEWLQKKSEQKKFLHV